MPILLQWNFFQMPFQNCGQLPEHLFAWSTEKYVRCGSKLQKCESVLLDVSWPVTKEKSISARGMRSDDATEILTIQNMNPQSNGSSLTTATGMGSHYTGGDWNISQVRNLSQAPVCDRSLSNLKDKPTQEMLPEFGHRVHLTVDKTRRCCTEDIISSQWSVHWK